ncbi:BMC domain-containing protein [Desulforamulus putei DSM 12395]|uniref:BMC domain-containing protein n=1 Tax=Desulforamulus putei DSM 12395 TaxID=1121429 RepID=A0A1M5CB84_9FIRM|nr:BMC domain-containing protein [Desulforamulus putei]SHF51985.1 BMC domain-containing protein [Desulforamulus putei DSM 12395]
MNQNALGLVEVTGLTAAIEIADTVLKSSNVYLIGYEKVTNGLVTVKIQGDVGAVKSAIDAAKSSAAQIGAVVSTLIIPRPAEALQLLVESDTTIGLQQNCSRFAGARESGLTFDVNKKEANGQDFNNVGEQPLGQAPVPGRSDKAVDHSDVLIEKEPLQSDGLDEPLNKLQDEFVQEPSNQSAERLLDKPLDKPSDDPVVKPEADGQFQDKMCAADRSGNDKFASSDVIRATNDLDQELDTTVRMDKKEEDKGITLREKDSTCNLCYDPLCPREKGQPRVLCIHSQKK